jgi:hypothetical protein
MPETLPLRQPACARAPPPALDHEKAPCLECISSRVWPRPVAHDHHNFENLPLFVGQMWVRTSFVSDHRA